MTGSKRARPRSRAAAGADAGTLVSPSAATDPGGPRDDDPTDRPVALRLARLHLRMGSLPLARAELESLAGRAMLDEDALLRPRGGALADG